MKADFEHFTGSVGQDLETHVFY